MNPCLLLALPEAFRELGESADANAVTWHAKLCLDGPDHHPEASNLMVGPRIFRTQDHTTVLLEPKVEEDCRAGSPFWLLFPRHDQLSPRGLLRSVREMHSIVTAGCTAEIESYCYIYDIFNQFSSSLSRTETAFSIGVTSRSKARQGFVPSDCRDSKSRRSLQAFAGDRFERERKSID